MYYNRAIICARGQIKTTGNQDELKFKARAAVDRLHWLLRAGDYEAAYEMIDDAAALKHPKDEVVDYLRNIVSKAGSLKQATLNQEEVLAEDEQSIYVRQDYAVKYAKNRKQQVRYEVLTWRAQPDEGLKLWTYINREGED